MNKLFHTISFLMLSILCFTGCKTELEDSFENPDQTTELSIPGFFTDILNNDRVRPSYWHYRTFILSRQAIYTQTASFVPSNNMYQPNDGYSYDYWKDFYSPGVLGVFRKMEVAYEALSEDEKANQAIFMQAARVVIYDEAAKMIDNFGDIPFSEAGSLPASGTIVKPKFEDQKELYYSFIASLKEINTFFSTATTTPYFSKYDILSSGDVDRWRRYTNSLRLRLLMRISNVDESMAQTEVMEMLNNPTEYPLIDGGGNANYTPGSSDILLQPLTTNTETLRNALLEGPNYYASDYMLNEVMKPADDPRIPVFYDKFGVTDKGKFVPNKDYRAMPITFTETEMLANYQKYSILDSATFFDNKHLPGIVTTASESNFNKAEAYLRWGSDGEAKDAYETAIKQSVTFYYYLNNLMATEGLKIETKPVDNVIDDFVESSAIRFAGDASEKLELILTQKWLHYGFLQGQHAWSEYRRTGYPKITVLTAGLANYAKPPLRFLYPTGEISNNSENYEAVREKDTRDTQIFWDID
ncbi:SusD/RagB family nutrient-binding outer membrane lipoprotein [Sphingobacterium shayense]|uniref:SusD/RagB family nutrient-binding outer membrane lipoprotein n=1 Tax=Sphingobacterium shayense TaxID=626343 RepID=UPI001556B6F7|nr:SusD/RagB family nutrient-binding outer membrane lipoprotein [Sphingobacterium shayense]NQD71578.1 SusD/RagB family nutrient-binding outer membrane lipoprotein [Sphingobacterium shayense]